MHAYELHVCNIDNKEKGGDWEVEKATIIIFCIAVMTTTAIMFVPISHRVFAFETDFPPTLVPVPLVEDLSFQVDNLNFSFPYHNTTLQIHIGSADIKCCSERMDENATRTQINLESRDVVMDGSISLKCDSLELRLTIITYHDDYDTYLYAEGSVIMPAWQYLWTFLSNWR